MAPTTPVLPDRRNRILHRFYEPLVLLFVLDRVQDDHLYPSTDRLPLHDLNTQQLRRRFLEELSYICDYKKGGDTVTAISVTIGPTYYVASNKKVGNKVENFLEDILTRLRHMPELSPAEQEQHEEGLLIRCAEFSCARIKSYWALLQNSLQASLEKCIQADKTDPLISNLRQLCEDLTRVSDNVVELCRRSHSLMKHSAELELIRNKAHACEASGNTENPFASVRHFVGRLAAHVRAVKVLRATALRLPTLFVGFTVHARPSPPSLARAPGLRSKLTLDGIANRMVSNDAALAYDLKIRLREWDLLVGGDEGLEKKVQKQYCEKNLEPRVHAELILLEYFESERIPYLEKDPFIGCSKPACYCCALYMNEHPAKIDVHRSHQKIYLSWLPPPSADPQGVHVPGSHAALHEQYMLNKIVHHIRRRTIEQITTRLGRREGHFDSVTGYVSTAVAAHSVVEMVRPEEQGEQHPAPSYRSRDGKGITQVSFSTAGQIVREREIDLSDDQNGDSVDDEEEQDADDHASMTAVAEDVVEDVVAEVNLIKRNLIPLEDKRSVFSVGAMSKDLANDDDSDLDCAGGVLLALTSASA